MDLILCWSVCNRGVLISTSIAADENGTGRSVRGNSGRQHLAQLWKRRSSLLHFVVDRNPEKHSRSQPRNRNPIVGKDRLRTGRPDMVGIPSWNHIQEVMLQFGYIRWWDGKFVAVLPSLVVMSVVNQSSVGKIFPLDCPHYRECRRRCGSHRRI